MKTCTVEGCDRGFWAKDMCQTHYQRMYRYGSTDERPRGRERRPGIMRDKECPKCGANDWRRERQKTTQRWTNKDGTVNEATYVYTEKYKCRECERRKPSAYKPKPRKPAEYGRRGKVKVENDRIKERMLTEQEGRCAICQTELAYADAKLDHDHACCPNRNYRCGKCSRGVLCNNCNTGIGLFGDDIERMISAIAYLASWTQESRKTASGGDS